MTTHEDIARRLDNGDGRFAVIEKKLDALIEAVKPLPEMQRDIAATKEIVEAWGAIKSVGRFVKWATGLGAGLAVIWAALKAAVMGGIVR